MVRIGPLTDRDRATAIAKQLSAGGFPAAQVSAQTAYRVLSEPLPRQYAGKLAAALAARGFRTSTEALTGDTVQLVFGGFASQKDAELLSGRISAAGYDAWIREAAAYTVYLGPYPQATVTTITDMVRAGAPGTTVAADDASSPPSPASPAPAARGVAPPSAPSPQAPAAPPAVSGQSPQPAPVRQASPPPSNALYIIRIGPVFDRDRAAAVAKQLAAEGFTQPQITPQTGYRVVSEPLPRKAAEDLVATLAGRGLRSQTEPLAGDSVQLLFGRFTSQKDAEALSSRIAAAGYDAWIREGPVYILRLGPYPQASVNAIAGIVKAGAPEAAVATDPVSTP
jgi:cell division septation protein DedD